ncbi:MAG: hypothetical protein GY816_06595 [Cytophagales bacterium]|nr:hypothetical protein [Cytophagales bacterium]
MQDLLSGIFLVFKNSYRVGIVGDYDHFRGGKVYKAKFLRLVKGKKIVFVPYIEGENYERIIKWEPFGREANPVTEIPIINANLGNINKLALDTLHKKIFGTSLIINPLTYKGEFLEKDGGTPGGAGHTANNTPFIIHQHPIKEVNDQSVYVRLIDNLDEHGYFIDQRVYVFKQEIFPCCRIFQLKGRFETQSAGSISKEIRWLEDEFSKEERGKMLKFVKRLQLDYGEIDVIRERRSKNIYLVDVNNTPYGDFRRVGFSPVQIKQMYRSLLMIEY